MQTQPFWHTIWTQLSKTKRFAFRAESLAGSQMHWNMAAVGNTQIQRRDNRLDFHDQFFAQNRHFSDRKRWILQDNRLEFWHERAGRYQLIFVFGNERLPQHHCAPDVYTGKVEWIDNAVVFEMNIVGQRKNERLIYRYFSAYDGA